MHPHQYERAAGPPGRMVAHFPRRKICKTISRKLRRMSDQGVERYRRVERELTQERGLDRFCEPSGITDPFGCDNAGGAIHQPPGPVKTASDIFAAASPGFGHAQRLRMDRDGWHHGCECAVASWGRREGVRHLAGRSPWACHRHRRKTRLPFAWRGICAHAHRRGSGGSR